jgi:16S rRNA (adenine(1408)-N(1))-methyltransferase
LTRQPREWPIPSLRASRPERRGGLRNALFVVAAAECPPPELCGRADALTILFPWGSLLRGALAIDDLAAAGIGSIIRPGGKLEAFLSITDRDAVSAGARPLRDADATAIARRWSAHRLELVSLAPATAEEIEATGSSWARRLRAGVDRPAWRIRLMRREAG